MALTKRQVAKAAKVYSLVVLANGDAAGADDDDQAAVMIAAAAKARSDLDRLGFDLSELTTIADCIKVIQKP